MGQIADNYIRIKSSLPDYVTLVVVTKTRSPEEIIELIDAGVAEVGENYVQEAEELYNRLGKAAGKLKWHMIGHLQKNKINHALRIFNLIQTVDSVEFAQAINQRTKAPVPVLIELNMGNEISKYGFAPDYETVEAAVRKIAEMEKIKVQGLMTLGPLFDNPEGSRLYFRKTKKFFEELGKLNMSNVEMKHLSMGTTNTYKVAVEEGSNMVRIGTAIFGPRPEVICLRANNDKHQR